MTLARRNTPRHIPMSSSTPSTSTSIGFAAVTVKTHSCSSSSSFSSQETAGDEEITAMPTFKYFKNGAEVRHALAINNGIIITTTIIIVIFVIII